MRSPGTYVSFHAAGNANPIVSDIKYYYLMKAWNASPNHAFEFENSHSYDNGSKPATSRLLRELLQQRLRNSSSFVLIITPLTRRDRDWVPWEIEFAIDECRLPVICAYPGQSEISPPQGLRHLWPDPLAERIRAGAASAVHVPFRAVPLAAAIRAANVVSRGLL